MDFKYLGTLSIRILLKSIPNFSHIFLMFLSHICHYLHFAEQQLRINSNLNARFMDKLNQLHNFLENVDTDINDVLTHYASEKAAERKMVLQTFQTFKDIPKAYVSIPLCV